MSLIKEIFVSYIHSHNDLNGVLTFQVNLQIWYSSSVGRPALTHHYQLYLFKNQRTFSNLVESNKTGLFCY